jgi:hypothetical protein
MALTEWRTRLVDMLGAHVARLELQLRWGSWAAKPDLPPVAEFAARTPAEGHVRAPAMGAF